MRVYYTAPRFDEHQFEGRSYQRRAVRVRYMGIDRWDTTGVSFDDYKRMGRDTHKLFVQREINAPSFALNTSEMKTLLARYFECRAGLSRSPKVGPPEWRLKMALRKIQKDIPVNRAILARLNEEYVPLRRAGGDPERLRILENAIRTLDREIQMAQRGPAPVVAVIYFYFRLGYNSAQVGAELGLTPMNVRQIAFRLTALWKKMQSGNDAKPQQREWDNAQVREHRKNFTPEQRSALKKYQREYKRKAKGGSSVPTACGNARVTVTAYSTAGL